MPKLIVPPGKTSVIDTIFLQDSTSASSGGLTGLTSSTSGLTADYVRDDGTRTSISLASMTIGTYTSGGFKEIDSTHLPGFYQFCPPDACWIEGSSSVGVLLKGAANLVARPIQYQIAGPPVLGGQVNSSPSPSTTQFGVSTSSFPLFNSGTGAYNGMAILFTSGANKLIARRISASSFSTPVITFTTAAFPSAPSNGDSFEILGA